MMMKFRFSPLLSKYTSPYVFVRPGAGGHHDSDGVWIPAKPTHTPCRGNFQPISVNLQQAEGGRYTEEDRTLYTISLHTSGDVIEYQGKQYTVEAPEPRDYCDVNTYRLKKVVANDFV